MSCSLKSQVHVWTIWTTNSLHSSKKGYNFALQKQIQCVSKFVEYDNFGNILKKLHISAENSNFAWSCMKVTSSCKTDIYNWKRNLLALVHAES